MISLGVLGAANVPASGGGLSLAYIGSTGSTADLATYNFTAVPIGTADATREVVVVLSTRTTGSPVVSSVSIGGSAATVDLNYANNVGGGNSNTIAVARRAIASGTTADISVTWGVLVPRCIVFVYAITGGPAQVADTGTNASTTSGATVSADVVNPSGGVVIAAHSQSATPTWSGNVDADAGATYELAAAVASTDTAGSLTITATPPTGGSALALVSYEPA